MRVALISLAGAPVAIGGKTLAERQLEFARAAGCERVVLVGNGTSREAIGLQHLAERLDMKAHAVGEARGLLGTVRAGDELLVLADRLLPDAPEVVAALARPVIVVLPAAAGARAGFERIDLERAWAGVLLLPGALVERLSEVASDAEAAPSLLRIALQAGMAERTLPDGVLGDGSWAIVGDSEVPAVERAWLDRHLTVDAAAAPSERLAVAVLRHRHSAALGRGRAGLIVEAVLVGLVVAAALLAWAGFAAAGFALVAVGAVVATFAERLAALKAPPSAVSTLLRDGRAALVDMAIVAVGAWSIEGTWLHKLFPPLVLLATLRLRRRGDRPGWSTDRALLSAGLAVAALLGLGEPAIMAAALALLAVEALKSGAWRG